MRCARLSHTISMTETIDSLTRHNENEPLRTRNDYTMNILTNTTSQQLVFCSIYSIQGQCVLKDGINSKQRHTILRPNTNHSIQIELDVLHRTCLSESEPQAAALHKLTANTEQQQNCLLEEGLRTRITLCTEMPSVSTEQHIPSQKLTPPQNTEHTSSNSR